MKVIMDDMRLTDINQIKSFLQGTQKTAIRVSSKPEKYRCITDVIKRVKYRSLKRSEKRSLPIFAN